MSRKILTILFVLCAIVLAACSSSQAPRLIGSYPANPPPVKPQTQSTIIYRTELELAVTNPQTAARRAIQYTYSHGGYPVDTNTWYSQGQAIITVELAVPSSAYESLHSDLLGLGIFIRESQDSQMIGAYTWDLLNTYSQITLKFSPISNTSSRIHLPDWRPIHTLQNAIAVSMVIFGFLSDILIWIVVVIGPFALIGWLIYRALTKKHA